MFLTSKINLVYDSILSIVYPQPCAVCGSSVESRADGIACNDCWLETTVFSGFESICFKCGTPLKQVSEAGNELRSCKRCDLDSFTAARSCGLYEKALRAIVLALKKEPHIPERLANILIESSRRAPLDQCTRIVPVPLHPERERARGFNQAHIIGNLLSSNKKIPFDPNALCRTVHTKRHRAGMDAKARRATVSNAFAVRSPRVIENEVVLLVDDVFTTGATASACAASLLYAGSRQVFVLTIARASYDQP
jgi:competence protein ComFC